MSAGMLNRHCFVPSANLAACNDSMLATYPWRRTLYRMLQKQIELGRIVMPPEEESDADAATGAHALQGDCYAEPSAVDEQAAWLLAAHRGAAGHPLPWDEVEAMSQERQDDAQGPCSPEARAAERERNAAEVREQMRGISRSLWNTVSVAASGAGSYTSRAASDFKCSLKTVAEMQQRGDLSTEHNRRRDGFSTYMEAAARDMVLRRSAGPKPPGGS
jgi:hypothetical protein